MIKQHSWTRQQYEQCLRWLRRGVDYDWMVENWNDPTEVMTQADYSWQASEHEFTGWTNGLRQQRFLLIKWRVLTQREELPF
jgi:hypothetical protein